MDLSKAFIQSAVQFMPLIHTPKAIGCHARHQPARQEQLGVISGTLRHAQGGIEPANLRLPDDCSYLLSHIAPSVNHFMGALRILENNFKSQ